VTRKDESVVENVNLQVQDDTADATLGLWGSSAAAPFGLPFANDANATNPEAVIAQQPWKPGETILLLQGPGFKLNRTVCSYIDT